jgi:hypothetical protein
MAFEKTSTANNVEPFARPQAAPAGQNTRRPSADAYVNASLATRDGGKYKLGAFALNADKPMDKQLLDHIVDADDMDDVLEQLRNRLVLDFKRADGNNGRELDLG